MSCEGCKRRMERIEGGAFRLAARVVWLAWAVADTIRRPRQ